MSKYNVGDMVIHSGGRGVVTKIIKGVRYGYLVRVEYKFDGSKDTLFFFEDEIIGKIN